MVALLAFCACVGASIRSEAAGSASGRSVADAPSSEGEAARGIPPPTSPQTHEVEPPPVSLPDPGAFEGLPVTRITIDGLMETHSIVVERELLFAVGDPFSLQSYRRSLQRLRNTRIFSSVSGTVRENADGTLDVQVAVVEKWTLIPVVRFGGGGGTRFFILGLYDLNAFGRNHDFGAQYENYNGAPSAVAWFRAPRLLGSRMRGVVEGGVINRPRALYSPTGRLEGAYLLSRARVFASADQAFSDAFSLGLGFESNADRFSERNLSRDQREANARTGTALPGDLHTNLIRARAVLGGLDHDEELVDGVQGEALVEASERAWGSQSDFVRSTWSFLAFQRFRWRQNLGVRLSLGSTNTTAIQHEFAVGGLEQVRGFLDGQFAGDKFWYGNFEYRIPSVQNGTMILQHVAFVDAARADDRWEGLPPWLHRPAWSFGGGMRLIVPSIARFNVRLDFARTMAPVERSGFVFGMQQYF